jgi:hypothetical protein
MMRRRLMMSSDWSWMHQRMRAIQRLELVWASSNQRLRVCLRRRLE